ncbi:MAG: type IV pilus modification protein PilV [Cocleimonas sp.]|nr:type IV pilus modification protein PilV [Cocleimonas sp.]
MNKHFNHKQHGFSLLEVLISMVIIAVGLLGLSGLQIASLKGTTNAHSRNVASLLVMELSERMRANPLGVAGAFYENDVVCGTVERVCRGANECSPAEVARHDVFEVMCGTRRTDGRQEGGAANLLPAGTLQVSCTGGCGVVNAIHDVTLGWSESLLHKNQNDTNTNADKSSKTLSMTIPIIP